MWFLTSESDTRVIYALSRKVVTIGRSVDAESCNFAILNDSSISRKHAVLSVVGNDLFLQDSSSRYGTYVNNSSEKLESKIQLNRADVVKFGKLASVWKVHNISFVSCASTLKGESLQTLRLQLNQLDGILKNDWDDSCTYLTMPAITLTIKVVLALVQGSHIVNTAFWDQCLQAVQNNAPLPDPNNYTPEVVESTLNKEIVSFLPNDKRKEIFKDKKFIFFSRRQLELYKMVLAKSSATALLLSESKLTKSMLCQANVIVIQYNITSTSQETQAQKAQINDIVNYLKSMNKRVVADAEIGLAVLYCSTKKYCNPDFNFSGEVVAQSSVPITKKTNVLAQESQDTNRIQKKSENIVINESLNVTNEITSKRKMSEEMPSNASKKFAPENDNSSHDNTKRKLSEDSNDMLNPSKKMAVDNGNNDDFFNFMVPAKYDDKENKTKEKSLNFSRPLKRKADNSSNDDDLFNFVEGKKSSQSANRNSVFRCDSPVEEVIDIKKTNLFDDTKVDISALRGSKLKELMESNSKIIANSEIYNVKKEVSDDTFEGKEDFDVGSIIVKIRNDLIIKKQPVITNHFNGQKNFKKFKKVWPVKRQATLLPSAVTVPGTPNS